MFNLRFGRPVAAVVTALVALVSSVVPASATVPNDGGLVSILVMGDSYSAGNGAKGYYEGTPYEVGYFPDPGQYVGCFRSANNYGRQFQRIIESEPFDQRVFVRTEACSGATTKAFTTSFKGQRPQIEAVNGGYDIIFLTIGGNDIDFAKIVEKCFIGLTQDGVECDRALRYAEDKVASGALESAISDVLAGIVGNANPDAKVVLLGYPYLEWDADFTIHAGRFFGETDIEVGKRVRELGDAGDRAQQAAVDAVNARAGKARAVFVNTKSLFAGHELSAAGHGANPNRWMVKPGDDGDLRWRETWYHPNSDGHHAEAQLLAADPRVPKSDVNHSGDGPTYHRVDVVLTIDTTGSMLDDIDEVKRSSLALLQRLIDQHADWRMAIVTYRDHPEETDYAGDYPSRLDLGFTSDVGAVTDAINAIDVDGGGDQPEAVLSGIHRAIEQPWRDGAKKAIVVLGDAPPKDPEPITGYTAASAIDGALAVDPAEIYPVLIRPDAELIDAFEPLAAGTGGKIVPVDGATQVVDVLGQVFEDIASAPVANAGGPYAGDVGQMIPLSASASFDPDGSIVSYEWDFDNDGVYESSSSSPLAEHAYGAPYSGLVGVRVTDDSGKRTVAQAPVTITVPEVSWTEPPGTIGDGNPGTVPPTTSTPPVSTSTVPPTSETPTTAPPVTTVPGGAVGPTTTYAVPSTTHDGPPQEAGGTPTQASAATPRRVQPTYTG